MVFFRHAVFKDAARSDLEQSSRKKLRQLVEELKASELAPIQHQEVLEQMQSLLDQIDEQDNWKPLFYEAMTE